MKVIVEYQGKRYESKENTEHSPDEVAEMFYENFDSMRKFQMKLADGGSLILGERALQSAVVMFLP